MGRRGAMKILVDIETKSDLDVSKVGADRYAEHPSTDVLTLSWQIDDGEVLTWSPFLGVERLEPLYDAVISGFPPLNMMTVFEAHNVRFERAIWREVMVKRYGAPPLTGLKMSCTMARCGYKAVPLKLERAAEALGLEQRKDMVGHKAMQALARGHVYKDPGVQFEREQQLVEYCAQDIRTEAELGRAVGDLSPAEQKVFELDMQINDRGVRLDVPFVKLGAALSAQYVKAKSAEFRAMTGLNPSQRDKVLAWCKENGASLGSLAAEDVEHALAMDWVPELPAAALALRKAATRASAKKYDAMLRTVCDDGRVHGCLQYHGASTGRWAGRLIQPHNFIRPDDGDASMGDMVEIIKSGDLSYIEACYGDPIRALSDATRAAIIPADGCMLAAGDLASIETHVLMWLAGEEEACKFMDNGKQKLYIPMAEDIYNRPIDKKKDLKEYTVGKIAILQLGYQAGWRGFQNSVKTMGGVDLDDEECQSVVKVYREEKYPRVPPLWRGLEDAMFNAVTNPGKEYEHAGIAYHFARSSRWLTCRLPSGRLLHYFDPSIVTREMPWTREVFDEITGEVEEVPVYKECVRYWAYKEGRLKPVYAYGGHNTENAVQAIARDFLVGGMFRAERAGLPVVLHVHDEVVTEPRIAYSDAAVVLEQCMTELPRWGAGCPMGASCWTGERYVK